MINMTREIKFRAWDKERRVMYQAQNVFLNRKGEVVGIHYFGTGGIEPAVVRSVFREGNVLELLQYTGLKDKNGKEIYEGDIVKGNWDVTEDIYISSVDFRGSSFSIEKTGLPLHYGYAWKECEIIGNIYENPELLK